MTIDQIILTIIALGIGGMIVAALSDIRAQVREIREEIESWSNKWKLLHEEELEYREKHEQHDDKRRARSMGRWFPDEPNEKGFPHYGGDGGGFGRSQPDGLKGSAASFSRRP